jgi:RNA polymerase sigma factor (sigma-70 family)
VSIDFEQLYSDHVWDVYGFLAYRLRERADAEDLTQLVFERALRNWGSFDPRRGSERTWLMTIARNALIDHQRRWRFRREDPIGEDGVGEDELPPSAEPGPDLGISPELAHALGTLRPREREVIALRFGGDLTGPEIAAMLELSLANVQQLLSRSLRKLRDNLGPADATT